MSTRRVTFLVALLAAAWVAPLARAQTAPAAAGGLEAPIGRVVSVSGAATIEHAVVVALQANFPSGPEQAKVGDSVYRSDVVQTGADGKLGLIFLDGSAFNLSANARMTLDNFIYDPNSRSNASFMTLTKGSLTFVSGSIAKNGNMQVDTPVATMGIRGTTPRIEIGEDGAVKFSTLVEGHKERLESPTPSTTAPQLTPRQRQARSRRSVMPSPEDAAKYNRLLRFDYQICRNC